MRRETQVLCVSLSRFSHTAGLRVDGTDKKRYNVR